MSWLPKKTTMPPADMSTKWPHSRVKFSSFVHAAKFSHDGTKLFVGNKDSLVGVITVPQAQVLCWMKGHVGMISCIAERPQGDMIASGRDLLDSARYDGQVIIWNVATLKKNCELKHQEGLGRVNSIVFDPSGHLLAVGYYATVVLFQDACESCEWPMLHQINPCSYIVRSLCFFVPLNDEYANRVQLLCGDDLGSVKSVNVSTGQVICSFEDAVGTCHRERTTAITVSSLHGLCLSGSWDATIRAWDLATGQLVKEGWIINQLSSRLDNLHSPNRVECLSVYGSWLVCGGGDDASFSVWSLPELNNLGYFMHDWERTSVMAVLMEFDGTWLVSTGCDGVMIMWATGDPGNDEDEE